jgi:2-oxoglutarate/2-oxoacid ferredoxin oxidoreductase subunit beta
MDLNTIGLVKKDYEGSKSTLCMGCGHDSVTQHIINACFQSGVDPRRVAKLSGIGCSSKTPAYFLGQSHGFNTLHGRMAPIATGAKLANRNLVMLGVSGDGDSASIGLGGVIHLLRRNLPMVYIVENNGVYGLTKGQFSATADTGSHSKAGEANPFMHVDLCALAIEVGCGFVARSFSGDGKQLVALIQAALSFPGTAFIDVISPCIAFANHEGSTRSHEYVRSHHRQLQELGVIHGQKPVTADYAEGESHRVELEGGTMVVLRKLKDHDHDVKDRLGALREIHSSRARAEILTGLFILDPSAPDLFSALNMTGQPLVSMTEKELRPPPEALEQAFAEFR